MPTWAIVLIIVGIVLAFIIWRHNVTAAAALKAKSKTQSIGVKAFNVVADAAQQIPVYGTAVKVGRSVVKPVNHILESINKGITTGLNHIPVAGKYLGDINSAAGSVVHKINSFFGLT